MRRFVTRGVVGQRPALLMYEVGHLGPVLVTTAWLPTRPAPGQRHAVGFSFGDLVSDITSPVGDAAQWLAGAGLTVVDAMGSALTATVNGISGFSSDVWDTAKSAASFVGQLPGVNIAVQGLEEATHLLRVILDSPITAICVVVLAAALNVVGLGSGLLAEYAALRLGMDLLDKLEHGDTFTLSDVAQAVIVAAGSATGLPVGAAVSAAQAGYNVSSKIANGQPVTPMDVANLTIAAASIGAGSSGDFGAQATVAAVGAASKVSQAAGLTAGETKKRMPEHLDQTNVAHLPDSVVRHVAGKIPTVAADAVARSPGGQAALTATMQRTQAELLAAARFETYESKDMGSTATPGLGTTFHGQAFQLSSGFRRMMPGTGTSTATALARPLALSAPLAAPTRARAPSARAFMLEPNHLSPVGMPRALPPYHLPLGYGPMYLAADIG